MLKRVFQKLDKWVQAENKKAAEEGTLMIGETKIQVIGQTAILEADLNIRAQATVDVDVYNSIENKVRAELKKLVEAERLELETVGHEAWMPKETQWDTVYEGKFILGQIARPPFVMISKIIKAPKKNKQLIIDYLAQAREGDEIFELAEKYQVKLEDYL